MKTRLLKFIESQGMTAARFADEIGIQRSAVSHVLSDRNKPGFDFIYKILTRFQQLNAEWLIVGTGSMLKDFKQASLFPEEVSFAKEEIIKKNETEPQKAKNELSDEDALTYQKLKPTSSLNIEKRIEKIVFFYSDKSFTQFHPNDI